MFPAGVHVASTWDASLIYARGNAMGSEAKGVGVHVQLAPVAGKYSVCSDRTAKY